MFVVVYHEVKQHKRFLSCVEDAVVDPPRDVHLVQFVTSKDGPLAHSLWVADSVKKVKDHVDSCLEDASEQDYHEVDEKNSSGLERVEPHGKQQAST